MKKFNFNFKIITILLVFNQLFTINVYANNSYPLNDEEIGVLFRYFTDVYEEDSTAQGNINFYNKKYEIFRKIMGNIEKKNEKDLKLYIALLQMVFIYKDNSESDFIEDKLYVRFLLQPHEYFNLIKNSEHRRAAFCYYLGRDFFNYLVNKRIKPTTTNLREYFVLKHSNDLKILGDDKLIAHCVNSMNDSSFERYLESFK